MLIKSIWSRTTESRGAKTIEMMDGERHFGRLTELTSYYRGAYKASLAHVVLWGADLIHRHAIGEETYRFTAGKGEIWLNGEVQRVEKGDIFVIHPGTWHAAKPDEGEELEFDCISAPAWHISDSEFMTERPEDWYRW